MVPTSSSEALPQAIGLIAGNGKFPILFARAAKKQRIRVVAAAVWGDTSPLLCCYVDKLAWFKVGELQKLLDYFRRQGLQEVIMAGQVNPNNLFAPNLAMDESSRQLLQALKDRKADTIFSAVAEKLYGYGLKLVDSTFLIESFLAPTGTLTKRGPTLLELADIEFGRDIAKTMGGLDVGQTVVVKEKAIVAIEAMEGTDRCILRGGRIAREGAVVVKMSKPKQDQRFDVPVIGPRTIKAMIKANARCLTIEAGKTIMIDREYCVKLANKAGICLVAA